MIALVFFVFGSNVLTLKNRITNYISCRFINIMQDYILVHLFFLVFQLCMFHKPCLFERKSTKHEFISIDSILGKLNSGLYFFHRRPIKGKRNINANNIDFKINTLWFLFPILLNKSNEMKDFFIENLTT